MNTPQTISYYALEIIASLVILTVALFVAVMAGGALVDRYRQIFGTAPEAERIAVAYNDPSCLSPSRTAPMLALEKDTSR